METTSSSSQTKENDHNNQISTTSSTTITDCSAYSLLINHSNVILKNLESLYLNEEFSDIKLIVDNQEIHAHRVILASSSDYFRALLYGGLQESISNEINLKCKRPDLFKKLLQYIYTGKINLPGLDIKEILEIFQMSHEYNFKELNETLSNHLISILSLDNVCILYDFSNYYDIDQLRLACLHYLDHNAEQVLKQDKFLRLSKVNLQSILLRDSFCANELDILIAVNKWIEANYAVEGDENCSKELYQKIRMNLIDLEKLIDLIRPSKLLNANEILDLIYSTVKNKEKDYRCFIIPDENIADERKYETKIIHDAELSDDLNMMIVQQQQQQQQFDKNTHSSNNNDDQEDEHEDEQEQDGDAQDRIQNGNNNDNINDEDNNSNQIVVSTKHKEIVKNLIRQNKGNCLLVEFKYPYKLNLIEMKLDDRDERTYSYYIEISVDGLNWKRIIDHTAYICRSWQFLYFNAQVVRYLRVICTSYNICDDLKVSQIQCLYTSDNYELCQGLIKPKSNVATIEKSAQVIEGVSRIKDVLLLDDPPLGPDIRLTSHQINNGSITIQLSQPYMISTIRFQLYDQDRRKYKYEAFVSVNKNNWIKIANRTESYYRSWQLIKLPDNGLPVVFIKIVGVYCSVNRTFNLSRFQCY